MSKSMNVGDPRQGCQTDQTGQPKPRKKTRDLCDEYQVSPVTVWRWVRAGILPKPDKINGQNYWPAGAQPAFDDKNHGELCNVDAKENCSSQGSTT